MAKKIFVTGASGFIGSHLVELLLQKNYFVTAYGSADACGGTSALTDFQSTISGSSASTAKFNFQATVYNTIDATKSNEARFTNSAILGQSVSQTMANTCWNTMTSIMSGLNSTAAENAPSNLPYKKELLQELAKVKDSANTACSPLAAGNKCALTNDVNLYREFYNIKLLNPTTRFTANTYLTDLSSASGNTEFFIYGSNVISTNSYLALLVEINILGKTMFLEQYKDKVDAFIWFDSDMIFSDNAIAMPPSEISWHDCKRLLSIQSVIALI